MLHGGLGRTCLGRTRLGCILGPLILLSSLFWPNFHSTCLAFVSADWKTNFGDRELPWIELLVSLLQNHYSLASFELFYKYNTYGELSSLVTALLIALLSRVWKITSSSFFFFFFFFLTFQRIDESKIKAILISNDHIRVTSRQSIVLPDFFISSFRRSLNIHEHTHRPLTLLACACALIGERSEPLSRVFNDQPRDIYGGVRTYVQNASWYIS